MYLSIICFLTVVISLKIFDATVVKNERINFILEQIRKAGPAINFIVYNSVRDEVVFRRNDRGIIKSDVIIACRTPENGWSLNGRW